MPLPSAGAWIRQGVVLFITFLEDVFDIKRAHLVVKIGTPVDEDAEFTGGSSLALVINNEQKIPVQVAGSDADGNAVPVTDLAVEILSQPTPAVFTVEVTGGDSFVVHSVEPDGSGAPTVGVGVIQISAAGQTATQDVVVETSDVTALTVTPGTPELENPTP